MANKRTKLMLSILCVACLLLAVATLAVGAVFAATSAQTGVVSPVAVITAGVALGLSALSLGALLFVWRLLRR